MIKLYFDADFKLIDREIPQAIVQYSTEDIEVYTQFVDAHTLEYNYVRPDGKQLGAVGLVYSRDDGVYKVWTGELTQFHTAYMPGSADTLTSLLSILARNTSTNAINNSPIIRLNMTRGIEPTTEAIEPTIGAELRGRMTAVELATTLHITEEYARQLIAEGAIAGAAGIDGLDGADGVSSYIHIAYATSADGSLGFSTTVSANKTYIGQYTDFISTDSQINTFYSWTLIKGGDGADGTDGVNGVPAYLHIAYATAVDGSLGFSTSVSTGKTYIGQYANEFITDSETYTDYNWTLIKGADGSDGSDGVKGDNAYLHIAYATAADGSTGFSTSVSTAKTYIGQYTNNVLADSETYTNYSWTLIKGGDGADGSDGADGTSNYIHIAYATTANGSTGFSTSVATGKTYIGTYTNSVLLDSETPGDYSWSLIKGTDGANGADGTDGQDTYLHIAYADSADGLTNFSSSVSTARLYMGTYSNFTALDSETPGDYTWSRIVGNDGADGVDGDTLYLHIAYSTAVDGSTGFSTSNPVGATYIGTYTNTVLVDSEIATAYTWVLFAGTDGTNGTNGTSVVLQGSVATFGDLPGGATVGDLYVVLADGDGYVWNGATWDNVGQIQGPDGAAGTNGSNAYVHFAYASSANGQTDFSVTPFAGAFYIGQYTDFVITDSVTYTDYTWSLYRGADGADGSDGTDGLAAYIHYAYATAADGSTGFSTTYVGGETYVGWYTDFTVGDSPTYTDYEWSLFTGSDGIDGADGSDGLAAYIHYAYATNNDGSTGFSTTYTGSETYVGWYTDFNLADSVTNTDYDWSLFTGADGVDGADGADGLSAYIHYAYSTAIDGSAGFSLTYTGAEQYVGFYTDFTATDSTTYTDYQWSLFKGADGANGADGSDGLPSYMHYAYSTAADGSTGFSLSYTGTENYVGFYTNFVLADSTTYTDYEWSIFTGADGANGTDGNDGLPSYTHYAYATNATGGGFSLSWFVGAIYAGWYSDFTFGDSVNWTDYEWGVFKGTDGIDGADGADGIDGTNGTDGTDGAVGPGLTFRGEFDNTKTYYSDAIRRDVVYVTSLTNYYALLPAYSPATSTFIAGEWEVMTSFQAVATDILLANDVAITRGLVLGGETVGDAFIRSSGMTGLGNGDGVGFYFRDDGVFRIGDSEGPNIYWSGAALAIQGDIVADTLTINDNFNLSNIMTIATGGSIVSASIGLEINADGSFTFGNPSGKRIEFNGADFNVALTDYEVVVDSVTYKTGTNDQICDVTFTVTRHAGDQGYFAYDITRDGTTTSYIYYGILTRGSSATITADAIAGESFTIKIAGRATSSSTFDYLNPESDVHFTTPNAVARPDYRPVADFTKGASVGTMRGGVTRTYMEPGVIRLDLAITFYLTGDVSNGYEVFDIGSTSFQPNYDVWGLLGNNPGIDYETLSTPYFKIDTLGQIKIEGTTTSEDPVTINASWYRTS
jgi:hypothetical protein